jgi:pimeloyl-ACP methyl ester carboxylesterase
MTIPTLTGITAKTIETNRIRTRVLFSGTDDAIPVIFVHGNATSATYWEENMLALPGNYRGIAPDLRGYGDADKSVKIDATRGMMDWVDDLAALMDNLNIQKAHFVGHSLGGGILWSAMMTFPERILSATQVDPASPYGFGGTQGLDGKPNYDDFAGSGGGVVSPEFVKGIAEGYRGSEGQAAPRTVMNTFYWKPPFVPAREEDLLSSLLTEHTGEDAYPGDLTPSANWPNVAPGKWGPINAASPKYAADISKLNQINPKPPVLWIRGADDQIVSDNSFFDLGTLGQFGIVPGWPGAEVFPPQPMVGQVRAVLDAYQKNGGIYNEIAFAECGHFPFIEKAAEFNEHLHSFIQLHSA